MRNLIGTELAVAPLIVFGLLALAGIAVALVVWVVLGLAVASGVAVDVLRAKAAH